MQERNTVYRAVVWPFAIAATLAILSLAAVSWWRDHVVLEDEVAFLRRQSYEAQRDRLKREVDRTLHYVQHQQSVVDHNLDSSLTREWRHTAELARSGGRLIDEPRSDRRVGWLRDGGALVGDPSVLHLLNSVDTLASSRLADSEAPDWECRVDRSSDDPLLSIAVCLNRSPIEARVFESAFNYLGSIRFSHHDRLFGIDFSSPQHPTSLMGSFSYGIDLAALAGPEDWERHAQMLEVASSGGGFIEYPYSDNFEGPPRIKMSYISAQTPEGWIVGAGLYIPDLESEIALLRERATDRNQIRSALTLVALLAVLLAVQLFGRRVAARVQRSSLRLQTFLKAASEERVSLEFDEGDFEDFREVVETANAMLHRRNDVERRLRQNEANLRITLDSIGDAVIALDAEGHIVRMNPAAEALTGLDGLSMMGCPVEEAISLVDVVSEVPVESLFPAALGSGEVQRMEGGTLLVAADGTRKRVTRSCAPIRADDGEIVGVVLVFRDITDQHALEAQLRHAQKMEAIGQLAGGVAHDFNNLLTGILGNAELLSFSLTEEPHLDMARSIAVAAERAGNLTQQLLGFSRRAPIQTRDLDVHAVIQDVVTLLERSVDKRIELVVRSHAWRSVVSGDPAQLQNAILNLALNARDAMPKGGRLEISTEMVDRPNKQTSAMDTTSLSHASHGYLCIEVTDTGTGIPEKLLDRIFEPFYTTKGPGQGTGLGLASVYGCVHSHRGEIDVTSTVGEGTCFRLWLPLAAAEIEAVVRPLTQAGLAAVHGKGRVLVVDDEPVVLAFTQRALERLGYSVVCCDNGLDGVETFMNSHFSLVILDQMMPIQNGLDTYLQLREVNEAVPVLLTSGFAPSGTIDALVGEGAAGFLQKPYSIEILSRAVAKTIAGAALDRVVS